MRNLSCLALLLSAIFAPAAVVRAADFEKRVVPLLEDYCYDCHGEGMKKGGFQMDKYKSVDAHLQDTEHWFTVWKHLQSQLMPPSDEAQPSAEQRNEILRWIEKDVFKVDPNAPDPGRVTIRRLNREEYRNTINDVLGVKFDTNEEFPADDTGYGFDTIGDVLSLSPLLMEKYMAAAEAIAAEIVAKSGGQIPTKYIGSDQFRGVDDPKKNARTLRFAEPASLVKAQAVEHPGRYRVTVELNVQGSMEATSHTAKLGVLVDGKEVQTAELGWDNRRNIKVSTELDLTPGEHQIGLTMTPGTPPQESENPLTARIENVNLHGPLDGSHVEYPGEYYRVFLDGPPPADAEARTAYGRKIVRHVAERAFRRPVNDATVERLSVLAREVEQGPNGSFERGIGHAITAMVASPRFIFRAEAQPEPNNPGKIVPIDEFALASRLSYFLWSSAPDEELLELARKGQLRANLRQQVDRLLAHERSERFVDNFVGQWLQTRDVEGMNIDARRVLGRRRRAEAEEIFSNRVRRAMRQETEMLFAHLVKENRSVFELLTADYTFLNEDLARFYDIDGVKGGEMRKVPLAEDNKRRAGILGHGSMLVVTSNPTRTSPVKRGLFLLDNLLGTPAPPAPPDVPELEAARRGEAKLTMREMMEVHRADALCASCHKRMDPLGLALESFNAIGQYREEEDGAKIDTAGQLITGEKFADVRELAAVLATSRGDDFLRCLTEKLLVYALGRGLEYFDTPTTAKIVEQLKKDGGAIHSLVYGVVESAPFQKRRGDGEHFTASN